jgi:hypothetical protein
MSKLVDQDGNRIVEEDNVVPPPMYKENSPPQVLTSDTARQGVLGKPVLWVLLAAVVLVCLGFLATWLFTPTPTAH